MNLPENICGKVRRRVWPGARSSPRWAGPKPRGSRARRARGGIRERTRDTCFLTVSRDATGARGRENHSFFSRDSSGS